MRSRGPLKSYVSCRTRYPDHPYHVRRVDGSAGLTVAYGHRFAVDREAKRNPIPTAFIFRHCSARPEIAAMPRWCDGHPNSSGKSRKNAKQVREKSKLRCLCGD